MFIAIFYLVNLRPIPSCGAFISHTAPSVKPFLQDICNYFSSLTFNLVFLCFPMRDQPRHPSACPP